MSELKPCPSAVVKLKLMVVDATGYIVNAARWKPEPTTAELVQLICGTTVLKIKKGRLMMENEVRLIDANLLRQTIESKLYWGAGLLEAIDDAPTIDPESLRPKGRWNVDVVNLKATCSECGIVLRFNDEMQISILRDLERFCYYCGADMRGNNNGK